MTELRFAVLKTRVNEYNRLETEVMSYDWLDFKFASRRRSALIDEGHSSDSLQVIQYKL